MKNISKGILFAFFTYPSIVWATQGVHLVGYGAKAQAMGGASVAYPQDAIVAANNPAGMAFIGNQLDADIQTIYVKADLEFGNSENKNHGHLVVPIPEFGINYNYSPNITLGLSTAASGVAFKYKNPVLPIDGLKRPSGSLMQVDLMPTITYKLQPNLALGLSLVLGYQQFEAQGIPGPFPDGQNPAHGRESALGLGVSTGVLWKPTETLNLGLSYKPKMKMSKLDNYKDDLFSISSGSIDSPESIKVGFSKKINEKIDLAFDIEHVSWSDVAAFKDLFNWRDQTIFKTGVSYKFSDDITLRSGLSIARKHITSNDVAPNFLLAGINSNAFTLGLSKKINDKSEFTVVGEYDFGKNLRGTNISNGTYLDADMYTLTLGYNYKF